MAKGSAASASESTETSKPYTLFVNTNLGTHVGMIVSEDDSLLDVKQKIVSVHADLYPEIGEINIKAIKVKRKDNLYRLSDSMPVKSAFNGVKSDWFLYVDATSSQLVSKVDYFYLESGSSGLRNCLRIMDEPSAQTEEHNVQRDQQSKRVSILDGTGGEESEGLNLGNKSRNFEQNKASLGTNKRTVSGKLKSCDPVSNGDEVAETHTEQKKDESGKIMEMQSDDILEEAAQLEPPKKKRRKEEKLGDFVAYHIKDSSKGSDTGMCVSNNETFKPDSSVPNNPSGETVQAEPVTEEKLTNDIRDGDSFCEPSEKEPSKPNKMFQENSLEDQQEISIRPVGSLVSVKRTKKICVSKNETFKPDTLVPNNSSGETVQAEPVTKEKLTNEMRDEDSFCEPSEKEPSKPNKMFQENSLEDQQEVSIEPLGSLVNVKRTKKKKSSRVHEGVDSVVSKSNENVRQENPNEVILGSDTGICVSNNETFKPDSLVPNNFSAETVQAEPVTKEKLTKEMRDGDSFCEPSEKEPSKPNKMFQENSLEDQQEVSIEPVGNLVNVKRTKKKKSSRARERVDSVVSLSDENVRQENPEEAVEKNDKALGKGSEAKTSPEEILKSSDLTNITPIVENERNHGPVQGTGEVITASGSLIGTAHGVVVEPSASDNIVADSLLSVEKVENGSRKMGNDIDVRDQAVTSGLSKKAKKVKKHKVGRAGDEFPVGPEPEKAFDGDTAPETKKEGDILSKTGKARFSIRPHVDAESVDSREHKAKRKSTKMKSSTSRSYPDQPKEQKVLSGDLLPPNDENKNEETVLSKKVKKSRLRKPTLEEKSDSLLEGGKDSAFVADSSQYQVSRNNGFLQLSSDTLEHNVVERPLEENFEGDDHPKNGCMDQDNGHMEAPNVDGDEIDFSQYFLPKSDNHDVLSPAKEPLPQDSEVRASDVKLKTVKKLKKLDKHSEIISSKENKRHKKKRDVGVSDTVLVPLVKDDLKPSPPPTVDSVPDKASSRKIVNASGTVTLVDAHRPRTSSNKESTVDKIYKNEKKGPGGLQSQADQYHNPLKRCSSNQMGEVLNFPKHDKGILPTSNTTFEDSGSESAQNKGEVSNSTSSTRTPASSSEDDDSDLDSHGSYGRKEKDSDVAMSQSKNMTLDMILRSSKSYKKAKQRATESQLEDTPEMVWDSLA